ncbi:hypothetical protein FRC12_004364 [Ceratobasidium sp. 428]|nr:hypothetical protein FRC12_004364 [Ceratobasidium sp. 428]
MLGLIRAERDISTSRDASCYKARNPPYPACLSQLARATGNAFMPQRTSWSDAQSPLHLLLAFRDALASIMKLTESGKIHRNISPFSLPLVNLDQYYREPGWLGAANIALGSSMQHQIITENKFILEGTATILNRQAPSTGQATTYIQPQKAAEMDRVQPICLILDTDLMVNEDRTKRGAHLNWTVSSSMFASAQLLQGQSPARGPVAKTFIHDIESLFWVLVWEVAQRSQFEKHWEINDKAKAVIQSLSQSDMSLLQDYKKSFLLASVYPGTFESKIKGFENDWSEDLAGVIYDLADYIWCYLYFESPTRPRYSRRRPIKAQTKHEEYTTCSRSNTFGDIFSILDDAIIALEAKYP